jgi:L-ascorbate metabolism protein UlaG (beta-lactamase superfamily)
MLIETKGVRILTDPGYFTTAQNALLHIDIILITHEHQDHIHADSLVEIMRRNPSAQVRTNPSVGKILTEKGIAFKILTDGMEETIKKIRIEGIGKEHAIIYPILPIWENTGYFIDSALFFPGDALTIPKKKVKILALPVEGPWMRLSEGIDYAIKVRPEFAFPVHDGRLKKEAVGSSHLVPKNALAAKNITFIPLTDGESHEFP